MSNITSNSLAAAVGSSVKNVVFKPTAQVVPRKILIIGTGDPLTEAGNVLNEPILSTSPEDIASKTGFGFLLHRLAIAAEKGAKGIETWFIQQAEPTGAQAAGDIDFTGSTVATSFTLPIYIAGDRIAISIASGTSADNIAIAVAAAINADTNLPVTAAVDGVTTAQVNITSKTEGTYGNDIDISIALADTDVVPSTITTTILAMSAGSGVAVLQTALDSLGTGDGANEAFFTDVIYSGYLQDTTSLDAFSGYVGEGNDFVGLYDKVVHKPFRALVGDVAAGSGGLSALVALGNGRKEDRGNGVLAVPGSQSHPAEIAAQAIGIMARINNNLAEQNYVDQILDGVWPGDKADRWTADYDDRDTAVKAGVSPTVVKNGNVYLQNVVSFYHPDSVPQTSNGYRSMRNLSILQNVLFNVAQNFEAEKWQGISIVSDVQRVGNVQSRKKARDTDSVIDDLVALARSFEANAWIFSASFTIDELKNAGSVVIRTGGDGFESTLKIVLSGEGNILDTVTEFDTSIAVFV